MEWKGKRGRKGALQKKISEHVVFALKKREREKETESRGRETDRKRKERET
jgi:hypothetical protein